MHEQIKKPSTMQVGPPADGMMPVRSFKMFSDLAKQVGNAELSDMARSNLDAKPKQEVRGAFAAMVEAFFGGCK